MDQLTEISILMRSEDLTLFAGFDSDFGDRGPEESHHESDELKSGGLKIEARGSTVGFQ
jgi:hypothetical protein